MKCSRLSEEMGYSVGPDRLTYLPRGTFWLTIMDQLPSGRRKVMIYVGLDVSLNSVAVCAVDETGKLIREGTTLADAPSIVQYLEPCAGQIERVGLEAGPTSEWLTAILIELGLPAVSLEARLVKAALSAMPVKTDRNDARGIAQVVRTGWFKPVHVKSISSQRARTLAAARKHIIRSIAAAEQVIRGLLRPLGLKVGVVSRTLFATRVRELVGDDALLEAIMNPLLCRTRSADAGVRPTASSGSEGRAQ